MRYIRPLTIEEAVSRVAEGGIPLAGGTVLVPELTRRGSEGLTVVDIGFLSALRELGLQDGYLRVGAMVTLARIGASIEAQNGYTALARAAAAVGNPQVRRVATVGGNLAFGLPVADLPPALLVLDAQVVYFGPTGEVSQPIAQVVADGIPAGCLILAVRIPQEDKRRSSFLKFAWRQASGKTIVSVATALRVEDNLIVAPRLAIGGLCHHATRLLEAERALVGRAWSEDLVEDVTRIAAVEAVCDVTGPPGEEYRRRLVTVGIRRALREIARP
jgi:carbon-monoxide dehydrogenase medium subunit